jgi:hypothetical protein
MRRKAFSLSMNGKVWAFHDHAQSSCVSDARSGCCAGAVFDHGCPRCRRAAFPRAVYAARNTNANVLKYAVRTGKDGRLDGANPIEAYWLMLAENGRREELTWTERRFAYGFSTSNSTDHGCVLRLTACPERELRVRAIDGGYRAEVTIAKQATALKRVFVCAAHGLFPSVRYVEISGINASGKLVSERLLPEQVSQE